MNQRSIEDERLRRDFVRSAERADRQGDCPGNDEIWEASGRTLDPQRTADLLTHSAACPACQESWRLAREMQTAGQAAGDADGRAPAGQPVSRVGRGRRLLFGLGVAAAAVLALVLFVPTGERADPAGKRFREGDGRVVDSLLDEATPIPADRFLLRWRGGPAGTIYTLQVVLEDLTVLYRAEELTTTSHTVPAEALRDLSSGTPLLWKVDALLPDTSRATSPVFRAVLE